MEFTEIVVNKTERNSYAYGALFVGQIEGVISEAWSPETIPCFSSSIDFSETFQSR